MHFVINRIIRSHVRDKIELIFEIYDKYGNKTFEYETKIVKLDNLKIGFFKEIKN
jgi:hypothetical protein